MANTNLAGAAMDLGLTQGSQLSRQVQDEVNERKKKAQQLMQQRQMFPATGMLLGGGGASGSGGM